MDQLMSVVAPEVGSLRPPLVLQLQLLLWSLHLNQLYRGTINLRLIDSQKFINTPINIPPTLVFFVSLSANHPLYASKLANRMAIFGTMPERTAPRPLYSARGISRFMMYEPVAKKPLGFV